MKKLRQFTGHAGAIYALDQGNSANSFFTGSIDGMIAEWNLETLMPEKFAIKIGKPIYCIHHILPANILLVGLADGSFHIIDLIQKKEIHHFVLHKGPVFSMDYSEKLNQFYVSSGDGSISVWDAATFKMKVHLPFCHEKIRTIIAHEEHLLIGAGDGKIRVLDTVNFNLLHEFSAHGLGVNSLCLHPHKNVLISGGKDAYLNFWSLDSFEKINAVAAHNYAIYQIQFHPFENIFATASRDKTVKIWDAASYEVLFRLDAKKYDGHKASVNNLRWNEQGTRLASVSDDRTLIVWES